MRPVWVFDIDGTLANAEHRLHHIKKQPKDWTAFFAEVINDDPIEHMVKLCNDLWTSTDVIFVSGRSDECRDHTRVWLDRHLSIGSVADEFLYMRHAGDYRPDDVIKIELLAEIRANGFDPIMVFDDRNRVVEAWRAAGVPCAQVAPGDF